MWRIRLLVLGIAVAGALVGCIPDPVGPPASTTTTTVVPTRLEGTWSVYRFHGHPYPPGWPLPTLTFHGTAVSGWTACNSFTATANLSGSNRVTITNLVVGSSACEDDPDHHVTASDSAWVQSQFIDGLQSTDSYWFEDGPNGSRRLGLHSESGILGDDMIGSST